MNNNTITINGQQVPVCFDMQTLINFEEITNGQQFFTARLDTMKERIALVMAAILSADKDTSITIDDIMGAKDFRQVQQIIEAFKDITLLMEDFFGIPAVEQQNIPATEQTDDGDEDNPKN